MSLRTPIASSLGLTTIFTLFQCLAACGDDAAKPPADSGGDGADAADTADTAGDTGEADAPEDVSDTEDTADTADTADTEDTADTADTTDTSEPGPALTTERFGARMWGPIIQMSRTDRLLWIGTRGNPDPVTGALRAGLYRLDLDTGAVRVYEDELPLDDYSEFDVFFPPGTFGPTPTAGVQRYGSRYLAVARTGLLLIDGSSVTPFPVTYEGTDVVPVQLAVTSSVAWMTSDRGLLRLDPETFAAQDLVAGADLGIAEDTGGDFGKLAVDPASGAVYAAYYASTGTSYVVRVAADGAVALLTPGEGGVASGLVGELAWSAAKGVVYVALGAWNAAEGGVVAWDGATASEVVREGALGQAHTGEPAAFGAQILALDDEHGWLAVGGQVQSGFTGSKGGGLVVVDVASASPRVVGLRTKVTPLYHWHTNHLEWDGASGRLYAAMSDLCSEVKLRNRGLFALSFEASGEVRYERPLLSGVRAVDFGEGSDAPLLGLRDDNGGLACEGYPIQTGLGRAQAGGSLTLLPVLATQNDGNGGILVDPGVTAMDAHGGLALGTYRDGFFLGRLTDERAEGFAGNQALLGPSLFTEDVVHVLGDAIDGIWIAGRTSHSAGDPPQLADRGPRGAALITLLEGAVVGVMHYVRASEDAEDIVGLPSSDVRDLYPESDGTMLAACAAERLDLPYDRMETELFEVDGVPRKGGLARLSGRDVTVLAGPEILPDPRAVTRDAGGRLVVADAERGVLRAEGESWEALTLPGLADDAVPQALWAGQGDDLALASSRGLWVRLAGRVLILDDVGFAWSLTWHGDRLYVGTDFGLVVVRPATLPPTELPASPNGVAPPFPGG